MRCLQGRIVNDGTRVVKVNNRWLKFKFTFYLIQYVLEFTTKDTAVWNVNLNVMWCEVELALLLDSCFTNQSINNGPSVTPQLMILADLILVQSFNKMPIHCSFVELFLPNFQQIKIKKHFYAGGYDDQEQHFSKFGG